MIRIREKESETVHHFTLSDFHGTFACRSEGDHRNRVMFGLPVLHYVNCRGVAGTVSNSTLVSVGSFYSLRELVL